MFALSHKSKQYLLLALKIFILLITFGYIYLKITKNEQLNIIDFSSQINVTNFVVTIALFLLLATINWFFEVLKWKTLVSEIKEISFSTSLKQSLSSLTVSLATPNRIGEYGAKAYFFKKEIRKQILLKNFFHNSFQMAVTVLFGIVGLFVVFQKYKMVFSSKFDNYKLLFYVLLLGLLIGLGFVFRKNTIIFKGLTLSNIYTKFKQISFSTKWKVLLFSIIRYFVFCFLFWKLLLFFGVEISIIQAFPLIFTMYLLVSILPTIFIFDVVVRGGVAVWLFSFLGISELPVLSTVFCMWILNFVFPSLIGSYYLLTYKPTYQ